MCACLYTHTPTRLVHKGNRVQRQIDMKDRGVDQMGNDTACGVGPIVPIPREPTRKYKMFSAHHDVMGCEDRSELSTRLQL